MPITEVSLDSIHTWTVKKLIKKKKSKPWQAYKVVFLCLRAIMHSFASATEGSCALIKLTSKHPCRHLQNAQTLLKSGRDGNLLCMSAAQLINSLFRLQPRLTLQPTEHIPGVPLSHRGHCSNSLTHESLLWLNGSSEVMPAAREGLCEVLNCRMMPQTSVWIKRFVTIQYYQS